MTDPRPAKSRGLSLFLWLSGGALWLMVFALLGLMWLRRGTPVAAEDAAARPAIVKLDPENRTLNLIEPAPIWDAKGVGDFAFTERSGETVTRQDLLGEPWVVGFVFTRCAGPCPRVTGQMKQLADALKDVKFRLVTLTVDPDYDTPEVLTRYADFFDAPEDKWLFLTGDKAKLYRYVGESFKMPVQEMEGEDRQPGFEVLHTTNLLLVDAKGVVQGKYNALLPEDMAKLRRDVRKLAK